MNYLNQVAMIALLALSNMTAASAASQGMRREIEIFLSTGFGNLVFIIVAILLLLWLLLPLAVFGLKAKLKTVINETRETNRLLTDIKNELAMIDAEATSTEDAEPHGKIDHKNATEDLYEEIRFDP